MFSKFFIKQPVFSIVCGLIILLVGAICIPNLPVDQFPDISPIKINVTANYTGASAEVVEKAVTNVLEREINGVEGMRYMTSSSTNSGTSSITVVFDSSRNKDIAAVDVQNRVAVATYQLPEAVQRTGVQVSKESNNIILAIALYVENEEYDNLFLSNYADLYLVDALKRVPGVGNVQIFGERRYAMRLWVDPTRLASRNLTMQDVVNAIEEQNIQVGVGQIGGTPAPAGQEYQIDLEAVSRLQNVAEFEDLVLKTNPDGSLVKFKDVGRAELGAESYSSFLRYRGNEAVGLGIYQLPGSNAIEVANAVQSEIVSLSSKFPPGLKEEIAFDITRYIEASMLEVISTLLMSIALVVIVIYLFLQDWRTTLVPAITIPLALIGTFAFIKLFNFSINGLTLFGLTLATGVVVDDAIVVVEDISRLIQEKGMKPYQAAIAAMQQLTGAVIATSLVLMAVFIPVAFFPGTTGVLYRQFALTIAFSITISTFLALTLTPALAAKLLRQNPPRTGLLGRFFQKVNDFEENLAHRYQNFLWFLTRIKSLVLGVFILLLGFTVWIYQSVPASFLPEEDQGYFITIVQAPEGVSLEYTSEVMDRVEAEILKIPEVVGTFAVGGFAFSGNSSNQGVIFSPLIPWEKRPDTTVHDIIGQLWGKFAQIPEARVFPVNPPAVQGLSNFGGFQFQLQDRSGMGDIQSFVQAMGSLLGAANEAPEMQGVFSTYAADTPKYQIEVNRNKAKSLNINIDEIFQTLQTALGSRYVNDFTLGQRNYRVYLQADKQFRSNPKDIERLYVRSQQEEMIPLSSLVSLTPEVGAQTINHFNLYRSIEISGSAGEGYSSTEAIQAMERVAGEVLPQNLGYEWSGISLEEIESGGQAPVIFALGLVFVFLVLSAQYGNFIDPLIILLAVPLAICGAMAAQSLRGLNNDIYSQVGLVMLIGLASKNSILIVEFANHLHQVENLPIVKAAVEASRERLRPILMTAVSTLLGIFPLTIATGAGAASRQSLGTAVFGGMFVATFLSLFIVPILYIVVTKIMERFTKTPRDKLPE